MKKTQIHKYEETSIPRYCCGAAAAAAAGPKGRVRSFSCASMGTGHTNRYIEYTKYTFWSETHLVPEHAKKCDI